MQKINEMAINTRVMAVKKLEELMTRKVEALSTVEIIVLIIVILGIVSVFSEGARTFVSGLWTTITTKANEMFS